MRLGTGPRSELPLGAGTDPWTNAPRFRAVAEAILAEFVEALLARERAELLLGFPAAPFILPFGTADPAGFVTYADEHPTHAVRLRFRQPEWSVSPWEAPEAYELTFNLPERLENWIVENEEHRFRRAAAITTKFLPVITVYRRSGQDVRVYQLRYQPSELRRRTS
jgi:hypothetical protein